MDARRFDAWTKRLVGGATSRRVALGALGASATAAAAGLGIEAAAACRDDGKGCKRDQQCCSGRCKKGKCRRAAGQGACRGQNACTDPPVACNGSERCVCFVTTEGVPFCGASGLGTCAACAADADCEEITGAGSVCVPCECQSGAQSACVPPCLE